MIEREREREWVGERERERNKQETEREGETERWVGERETNIDDDDEQSVFMYQCVSWPCCIGILQYKWRRPSWGWKKKKKRMIWCLTTSKGLEDHRRQLKRMLAESPPSQLWDKSRALLSPLKPGLFCGCDLWFLNGKYHVLFESAYINVVHLSLQWSNVLIVLYEIQCGEV